MTRASLSRILRFGVVGGCVTLLGYAVFLFALYFGFHYILASALSWLAGIMAGFVAHRRVTFGADGGWRRQASPYLATYVGQFLFGTATLALLVDGFGLVPGLAYPVNVIFTATFSYIVLSRLVFRTQPMQG